MRTAVVFVAVVLQIGIAWGKKPLPEKAKLDAAKLVARDRYFTELKQANEAALKTFLDAADATNDDDARQAALYLVVADAAVESGQLPLALEAAERVGRQFDYDVLAGKLKLLESASKATKNSEARNLLVNRVLELIDEAVDAQRFDVAEQAAKLGESVAARLRDAKLRKELTAKRSKVEARRRENSLELGELARAEAVLKDDPNDAEANRILGVHLATNDQWPEAIEHLARADDEELREAAEVESERPDEPQRQIALADTWWQLADSMDGDKQRAALRARAVYWYSRAVAGLSGPRKTRATRRIKLSGAETAVAAASQTGIDDKVADILLATGLMLRLVKIPGSDEKTKTFWLSETELTEPQWVAVMGGVATSRDLPKVNISFNECRLLCEKMNAAPIGRRYRFRLPTRDEFVLACGKPATYSGELADHAWCFENSPQTIQPVAQKKANPCGLYDIVGNVWELADDGKFYGMSSWESVKNPDVAFTSVDLPTNYQGLRADYRGVNLGVRIAADRR